MEVKRGRGERPRAGDGNEGNGGVTSGREGGGRAVGGKWEEKAVQNILVEHTWPHGFL